ncbi:hypothetical protein Nepgr_025260 [Nepenthes gracilis]|uniref:Uncharacterized protein n=1 Tax=Nepenthes gracilis TaxID=150966 RepID=A0AAD3T7E2_NEPGR|nr:hypothetical protein Nepgr_025260 [Nepenthes gracilis]
MQSFMKKFIASALAFFFLVGGGFAQAVALAANNGDQENLLRVSNTKASFRKMLPGQKTERESSVNNGEENPPLTRSLRASANAPPSPTINTVPGGPG